MKRIPIVDAIIENEKGEILMLKRNFYPEKKLDLLGGYIEKGEGIEGAAIRESKEESGYDVELLIKMGEYDYFDRGEKKLHVFIAKIIGGELQSSKEGEPLWIDPVSISAKDLAFPQVHVEILDDFLKFKGSQTTL